MTFSDDTLMAYADGELDPAERAAIEQAMQADPAVAAAVARHRALRADVAAAFADILDEPVPARLQPPRAQAERAEPAPAIAAAAAAAPAPVASLAAAREARQEREALEASRARRRWSWPEWGALAAMLVVGVLVGRLAPDGAAPAIAGSGGQVVAQGDLAAALDRQVGGSGGNAGTVRIGVSFAARDGQYCRSFVMGSMAGLACRDGSQWWIPVVAEAEAESAGGYRQAGSALPPAVLDAIDARIAGKPLDAAGEAAAHARGWRPGR